ncbi:MFS transporter [Tetragenococcus solitarius]|uniref:Major facilitator superfamily (MFS) profile domain-containing protein n=1 Tax=Tetragenococcus solitarius TaxID=71453 RepID=A0ABN3Y6S2_9ENTE
MSQFGSSMYEIVLPLLVLELTGSLTNVGLFYSVIKIPGILLLPFLGAFVERHSRKKILFFCNLFTFIIFSLQFLLFKTDYILIEALALLGLG